MAATTNYGWEKPTVGADTDTWGTELNTAIDGIDTDLNTVQTTADAALPKAGGTMTGALVFATATTSIPSARMPHGTAPSSPTNGDMWSTTSGFFGRVNSATIQFLATDGSGASLTALNATQLTSGTVPDARFPATLPAASGVNLTALNASNLASGTVPDARFPATLPAASGVNLTALNATNLASGTVPDARFPATLPAASGANLTSLSGANITAGTVTLAAMSDLAASRFIGRVTASTGVPEAMTGTQATTLLDTFTSTLKGLAPLSGGGTTNFLRADGTWAEPPGGSSGITDLTGDVTASGTGSVAATIASGAVTLAKMANLATDRLIGRDTAGSGVPEALTVTGGLEFNGSGIQRSALTGDVTASAGSNATTIAANVVSNSKFRQSAGLSVVGTAASSTANVADITAGTDGHVLRRSGTTLGFGKLAIGAFDDAVITYAKIQNVSATDKILGRSTSGAGVVEEITCTAAGRALLDDAAASNQRTTLGLGTMATRNVTVSTSAPSGGSDGDLWFVRAA